MRYREISQVGRPVLLRVCSTSNNTVGNERVMFPGNPLHLRYYSNLKFDCTSCDRSLTALRIYGLVSQAIRFFHTWKWVGFFPSTPHLAHFHACKIRMARRDYISMDMAACKTAIESTYSG